MNLDIGLGAKRRDVRRDSDRIAASLGNRVEVAFAFGSEGKTSEYVVLGQIGEVSENLVVGHAAGEIAENVVDGDAQPANAGLAAALIRFHRNDLPVVNHDPTVREKG